MSIASFQQAASTFSGAWSSLWEKKCDQKDRTVRVMKENKGEIMANEGHIGKTDPLLLAVFANLWVMGSMWRIHVAPCRPKPSTWCLRTLRASQTRLDNGVIKLDPDSLCQSIIFFGIMHVPGEAIDVVAQRAIVMWKKILRRSGTMGHRQNGAPKDSYPKWTPGQYGQPGCQWDSSQRHQINAALGLASVILCTSQCDLWHRPSRQQNLLFLSCGRPPSLDTSQTLWQ